MAARSSIGYPAVADRLRERVESGVYAQGSDLPSASALAVEFRVSAATVRRALHELDMLGLTGGRRGRPRIVLGPGPLAAQSRAEQVVARLRRDIRDGALSEGVRLPAET